jgi:hypothetical protein
MGCGIGMALLFCTLLYGGSHLTSFTLGLLFFLIGMLCCYQVLIFAIGSDLVSPSKLGVTIAFLNCVNMLGGSFFHSTIGFAMDMSWTGTLQDGIRAYEIKAYHQALMIIPVCALIGSFLIALAKKSPKTKPIPSSL